MVGLWCKFLIEQPRGLHRVALFDSRDDTSGAGVELCMQAGDDLVLNRIPQCSHLFGGAEPAPELAAARIGGLM